MSKYKLSMPKQWYDLLVQLCFVQSHSRNEKLMVLFLDEQIKKLDLKYTIDGVGNIIVTKGTARTYPCVVSHMDTVHRFVNNYHILHTVDDNKNNSGKLFAKNGHKKTGIGGDDKCGIFSCLYFLKTLPVVKVVFFTQEETGCVGSNGINKTFFDDCRYIIQLDRKGKSDFIDSKFNQKIVSHQFSSEVGAVKKAFGFKSAIGTITDAVNLWEDGVGISCVNISSGYYSPHSDNEYIMVDDLWNSVLFTQNIISTLKSKRYPSVPPVKEITTYGNSICKPKQVMCSICKTDKYYSLVTTIENKNVCFACIEKEGKYKKCSKCYSYQLKKYIKPSKYYSHFFHKQIDGDLCSVCRAKIKHTKTLEAQVKVCEKCKGSNSILDGSFVFINGETQWLCDECVEFADNINDIFTCDICGKNISTTKTDPIEKYGKKIEGGTEFVCTDCANDYKEFYKDTCFESCSVCDKQILSSLGHYDGEIFICHACSKQHK